MGLGGLESDLDLDLKSNLESDLESGLRRTHEKGKDLFNSTIILHLCGFYIGSYSGSQEPITGIWIQDQGKGIHIPFAHLSTYVA